MLLPAADLPTGVTVKCGANGKCQSWRWPLLIYTAIPFDETFSGRWSLRKVYGKGRRLAPFSFVNVHLQAPRCGSVSEAQSGGASRLVCDSREPLDVQPSRANCPDTYG